jgi:predicted nucleic-acid-binding Zn-ribbon protein
MEFTDDLKQKIIDRLEERNARLACPRCGNNNFVILDGYVNQPMSNKLGSIVLGGPTIPTAVIACSRCGFLSLHALGVLGLFPEKNKEETNE